MKEKEAAVAPAAPSSTDKILLEVHQELKNIREELRSK